MASNLSELSKLASAADLRMKSEATNRLPSPESLDFKQKIFHRPWVNREEYILERLADFSSVVHLGCSDAPFTESLLEAGNLLHFSLLARRPEVVGFDLSPHGIQLLSRARPDAKFVCGNAEMLDQYFAPNSVDLVIAGEIVEHLSNPGTFFESCAKVLSPDGVLLITIPNTFGMRRYFHSLFGIENYHPDHTFYFSENTVANLAGRYGFSIFKSRYYGSQAGQSWMKKIIYACIETLPAFFLGNHFLDGLVIELKKQL